VNTTLRWGIIGAGGIARVFSRGLSKSATGTLVAVGSRTLESAQRFGAEFKLEPEHCHGSYAALLADGEVDAVYIATPHPFHAEWAIRAADAGKHILCEKPLALNHAEAMAIVEAARRNGVFLMEAFMYRCHPQTAKLVELIRAGTIGEVRLIEAAFSFHAGFNPESRLFNQALGGGGVLDVGCYCVSMARLVAGAATGKDFAEPLEVTGAGHIGPVSRVDEYAVATLRFPGGILAQLSTGVQLNRENGLRVWGSEGNLFVPQPWIPGRQAGVSTIVVQRQGEQPEEIRVEEGADLYAIEADAVARALPAQEPSPPCMTWDDSLGNMRTLDLWRRAIGLVYDAEQPAANTRPVHGRPLELRPASAMHYGELPGIAKRLSRVVLGVDNQETMPHAAVMFDDFFERGGTVFDTAYIYRSGNAEKLLGHWMKNRGVREEVVILDKGAHTPFCDPENLTAQLLISLDRLQSDYVDLYMLHRDNPAIPVGEFVDVLNEHKRAGRIHAFGASNWSIARVEEANAYARARGLDGFVAMSNNFSLARMVEPIWDGSIATSDPESRAWFTRTQMPLMPWSSQARGFFAGRAHPDDHSDPELARCWYSADNFQRLARVEEMARQRGVLPINIALAYVLCQPFPTFPLIGPRTLAETRTSWPALDIHLSEDELRWLNLEGTEQGLPLG
jgi:predicted dehydrogenase/aryl-alcohol dehydrogenase-like predicted oxidoreductase